jgi:hypothetical protein
MFLSFSCSKEEGDILGSENTASKNEKKSRIQSSNVVKKVKYKNLDCTMPEEFSEDLLTFSESDYEEIFQRSSKKKLKKLDGSYGDNLPTIFENVKKKYPDLNRFETAEYKKFFPTLSDLALKENSEAAMEYIEKLIAYETAVIFMHTPNATLSSLNNKNKKGRLQFNDIFQWPCAIAIWVTHARIHVNGIYTANDIGLNNAYYPSGISDAEKNAVRHGAWATLIAKYALYRYSDVNKIMDLAYRLVSCHEIGLTDLDSCIDRKNNLFSAFYYLPQNITITGPWYDRSSQYYKSPQQIITDVNNAPRVDVSTVSQINNHPISTLVY